MLLNPWEMLGISLWVGCLGVLCLQGFCWVRVDSRPMDCNLWFVRRCLDWSFFPGQESRILIGLTFPAVSPHTAHLVAGVTFAPIYVFTSRPSLWSIWELSQIEYLQLYDEMQFSQEMNKRFSFSRARIKKRISDKCAISITTQLGALGNYTLGQGT